MPTVKTTTDISNSSIEAVWRMISDLEDYPRSMQDILEVRCIERTDKETVTSWKVLLDGSEMTWTERDIYEPYHRITFSQLEGDMDIYRGQWLLEQLAGSVRVSLHIEFDIGIPSLTEMLDPIAVQAIEANSRQMLSAVKKQLCSVRRC